MIRLNINILDFVTNSFGNSRFPFDEERHISTDAATQINKLIVGEAHIFNLVEHPKGKRCITAPPTKARTDGDALVYANQIITLQSNVAIEGRNSLVDEISVIGRDALVTKFKLHLRCLTHFKMIAPLQKAHSCLNGMVAGGQLFQHVQS